MKPLGFGSPRKRMSNAGQAIIQSNTFKRNQDYHGRYKENYHYYITSARYNLQKDIMSLKHNLKNENKNLQKKLGHI